MESARTLARFSRGLGTLALVVGLVGCGSSGASTPEQRGREVYLSICVACHNADPSQSGPLGPPIKGSSRELLEARILRAAYPPGYHPKRDTRAMVPQPQLTPHNIDDLAAYLR